MTDSKTSLAAATAAIQEAGAAFDAERAASDAALAAANAEADALRDQVAQLQAKLDPWVGVDKTGATDVTAKVQALIDQGLAVPAGHYLIDPVKGLTVKRNVTLSPDAILIAKASSAPRYCVLTLEGNDLTLTGGQITGDRLLHTYTAGSTHEWGYGLMIKGDRCKVDGLHVIQCTGDGIGVVGDNCEIRNVSSLQNRRQGMSVFTAPGLKVYDSEFSFTGALGADPAAPNGPCAGVDIEPDVKSTVDAIFERCTFKNNRAGVLAWLRSEVGGSLNITLKDCAMSANANGVQGRAVAGTVAMKVTGSTLAKNTGAAVRAESGATVTVGTSDPADANMIVGMAMRTPTTAIGIVTKYDLQRVGSPAGVIVAGVNHYA